GTPAEPPVSRGWRRAAEERRSVEGGGEGDEALAELGAGDGDAADEGVDEGEGLGFGRPLVLPAEPVGREEVEELVVVEGWELEARRRDAPDSLVVGGAGPEPGGGGLDPGEDLLVAGAAEGDGRGGGRRRQGRRCRRRRRAFGAAPDHGEEDSAGAPRPHPRARRRSAMRSSPSSMPTDSRTRSAGT